MNNNETGQAANPMSAFVGVDFDCEFSTYPEDEDCWFNFYLGEISERYEGDEYIYHTPKANKYRSFKFCRPRLNRAQVLNDWSWVPDGLVWNVVVGYTDGVNEYENVISASLATVPERASFVTAAFIGVEANKGLDEWAKANDVPVVTL